MKKSSTAKLEKVNGIIIALTWSYRMRQKTVKQRLEMKNLILERIRLFNKGKASPVGEALYKQLKSEKEWQFIGFAPYVSYIMADSEDESHLGATWIHPYSMPTLLYKHRNLPMIIQVNPEITWNKSKVYELNKYLDHLKDTKGIMG